MQCRELKTCRELRDYREPSLLLIERYRYCPRKAVPGQWISTGNQREPLAQLRRAAWRPGNGANSFAEIQKTPRKGCPLDPLRGGGIVQWGRMGNLSGWVADGGSLTDWLQAIGTLGALWFAVIQVTRDGRAARRRARAQLVAAQSALRTAWRTLERTVGPGTPERSLRDGAWMLSETSMFQTMVRQLDAIPLHELGDSGAVDAVMAGRASLASAAQNVELAAAGKVTPDGFLQEAYSRLRALDEQLEAAIGRAR